MSCIQFNFEVNGDRDDILRKSVSAVAGPDNIVALTLASYFENAEFLEYAKQELGVTDLTNANQNKLRKVLKSYFSAKHLSIYNTEMINQAASRNGFLTEKAQNEAKIYTADLILEYHKTHVNNADNRNKPATEISKMVLKDVVNRIKTHFEKEVVSKVIAELKLSHPENRNIKRYEEVIEIITKNREKLAELDKDKRIKEKAKDKEGVKAVIKERNSIIEENNKLVSERYVLSMNLISMSNNDRAKNYAALVANIRGNSDMWFGATFTKGSKLFNILRDFEAVIDENGLKYTTPEAIDEADIENLDNDDSIDQMSKAWTESLVSSFDKYADSETKYHLSFIYKLNAPVDKDTTDDNVSYDTNNSLGVKQTMPLNYVIAQIQNIADFSSVNAFIESLYTKCRNIEELYGLTKLAVDMMQDRQLANMLFHNLANPKVTKAIISIDESRVEDDIASHIAFSQSNASSNTTTFLYYNFVNNVRSNFKDAYNEDHIEEINKIGNRLLALNSLRGDELNNYISKISNDLDLILSAYIPTLPKYAIQKFISVNKNNPEELNKLVQTFKDLLTSINNNKDGLAKQYNDMELIYAKAISEYKKDRNVYAQAGMQFNKARPVRDYSKINYGVINAPCIRLAQLMSSYVAVKNELNSANAEGNLASDLLKNSFITQFLHQIKYGTENEVNAGLEQFKKFINKSIHNYKNNQILFGVRDKNGNLVKEGIFKLELNGDITITKDAKKLVNIILFDGVKDNINNESSMYAKMSKADYMLSVLTAYTHPVKTEDLLAESRVEDRFGGFFLQTPSDAPKNFIFQTTKYSIFGPNRLWTPNKEEANNFVNNYFNKILERYKEVLNKDSELKLNNKKPNGKQSRLDLLNDIFSGTNNMYVDEYGKSYEATAEEIYGILNEDTFTVNTKNNKIFTGSNNKSYYPLNLFAGDDIFLTVWVTGTKVNNNKLINCKVVSVNTHNNKSEFSLKAKSLLKDTIIEKNAYKIKQDTNANNELFRVLYQQLLSDFEKFVHNINNVFERVVDGDNVKYITRTNLDNLFEKAHYGREGIVGKDHKLAGNFFKFIKLFKTDNFDTNAMIEQLFSLYGEGNANHLMSQKTKDGIDYLEVNFKYFNENSFIKFNEDSKRFEFVLTNDAKDKFEQVVTEWINSVKEDIIKYSKPYTSVLEENGFDENDVVECMLNNNAAEMALDDLFTGGAVYHVDAREFLKRAKEIQAGGYAYGNYDVNDEIGGELKNIKDLNGHDIAITINDIQWTSLSGRPLVARTGFKAVTIANTVNSVEVAPRMEQELYDILKNDVRLSSNPQKREQLAKEISKNIAKGYSDKNKLNDAQSYITLDEFIARMHANGTLHHYDDILQQIRDIREGKASIKDLDLIKINARIQVQKNFYFDHQFDDSTGCYYPRQIKNAEFVLIPELLEGTDLKKLYDIMDKYDIGQINTTETSKAAKRNIIRFWDDNGVASDEMIADFEKQIAADQNKKQVVENYYYRYLYKQQDVPQHMQDSQNKAGIQVIKKIIDNAPDELREVINTYMQAYIGNIKEDFNKLLNNMGWTYDKNGNLINKNNPNATLNFEEFYKQARREAQRLNMDSNFIDYLTVDELGNPLMPNYMSNVASKLESVAQSLFNSAITRQKLPGWHGAQVTGIGHGVKVKLADGTYSTRKLQYHPEVKDEDGNIVTKSYAEILVPRWSKLIGKEITIDDLAKEGLDIQIGYRIPTEGKQSVSVLKVVGFLDDVYGSTVMVPDEWVVQTGSDFDVDSIYAIVYEMYKNRNGEIKKYIPNLLETEHATKVRYINHINSLIKDKIRPDSIESEEIKTKLNNFRKEFVDVKQILENDEKLKELYKECNDIYHTLPDEYKEPIAIQSNSGVITEEKRVDFAERYYNMAKATQKYMSELESKEQTDDTKKIIEKLNKLNELYTKLAQVNEFRQQIYKDAEVEYFNNKGEFLNDLFESNIDNTFNLINSKVKEFGLISYEEFSKLNPVEQNSRRARNNLILECMVRIMEDASSREENYSRSNFDDLINANTEKNKLRGAEKVSTSPYNILTQIDYMENAISGKQLKAFSVSRDTFNSVNNKLKSKLSVSIPVKYRVVAKEGRKDYDLDIINSAYDGVIQPENGSEYATVNHNCWAWSKNNRNVVGKLLTPYSSQTTAHILDAIKEGTIFNENEFTFGTFKTLIDVGVDYDTAISFLMQPGITKINDIYYESNSVFTSTTSKPIETAIKQIANSLGVKVIGKLIKENEYEWHDINEFTDINTVYIALSNNKEVVNKLREWFGPEVVGLRKFSIENATFPIDQELFDDRLKSITDNSLNEFDKNLIDLVSVFIFKNVNGITKKIEDLQRCTNPDKFGAKQTIFSTRKVITNILTYIEKNEDGEYIDQTGNALLVDGKPMLEAIYPNIDTIEGINVELSKYPSLAAFLKYSTLLSVKANGQLFTLENEAFYDLFQRIETQLGRQLTEDQYKEYKNYLMNFVYTYSPTLVSPIGLDENNNIINIKTLNLEDEDRVRNWADIIRNERNRIIGYDVTTSNNISITDINKPTKDELTEFMKLTPAQKVLWIQHNFKDGGGICDFLNVNLFNQYEFNTKGVSKQRITYSDQIDDVEELFNAFNASYFNKNELIRLTAIDLVKYAFIAEGFRFKKGTITKIIPNKVIYEYRSNKGMQVIQDIEYAMSHLSKVSVIFNEMFVDSLVRANQELVKKFSFNTKHTEIQKAIDKNTNNGMINIVINNENLNLLKSLELVFNSDFEDGRLSPTFVEDFKKRKKYVRINLTKKKYKSNTLYKIRLDRGGKALIISLIPLNPIEKNEIGDSVINSNNKFKKAEFYETILSEYLKNLSVNDVTEFLNSEAGKQLVAKTTIDKFKSDNKVSINDSDETLYDIINLGRTKLSESVTKLAKDISKEIIENNVIPESGEILVRNNNLELAHMFGNTDETIQKLPKYDEKGEILKDENGVEQTAYFKIKKHKSSRISRILNGETTTNSSAISKIRKQKKNRFEELEDKLLVTLKKEAIKNPIVYEVHQLNDNEISELQKVAKKEIKDAPIETVDFNPIDSLTLDDFILMSIVPTIGSIPKDRSFNNTSIEDTARNLAKSIFRASEESEIADRIRKYLTDKGVDVHNMKSISENKRSIYTESAEYYEELANEQLDKINNFKTEIGTFAIDDDRLYEYMTKHPEIYPVVLSTILEAKHFGSKFDAILSIDPKGEDEETTRAVKKLQDAINKVRNNPKVKNASKAIFNKYLANEFSENPLIKNAYVELTTTFGDTDWLDLTFSDVAELNNSQVQTVVKYVYTILNEANNILAPRAVDAFNTRYNEILNGTSDTFSWDNIITKEGMLIKPYTQQFLDDYDKNLKEYLDIKERYGVDSMEYIKAKLKYDKWKAINLEQEIVQSYYLEDIANREEIINKAPELYLEYMKLSHEFNNIDSDLSRVEVVNKRKEILNKMSSLWRIEYAYVEDPDSPTGFKVDEKLAEKVKALSEFLSKRKKLNAKYFKNDATEQFKKLLKQYTTYINKYDKKHPTQNLSEKLENEDYRNAYNWLEANAVMKLNEEARTKITEAFKALKKGENEVSEIISNIEDNIYDAFGNIDGRKVSKEIREQIRQASIDEDIKDENDLSEDMLFKEIPKNLPIFTEEFYKILTNGSKESTHNQEKLDTIKIINTILSKAINENGTLDSIRLIKYSTEEELNTLMSCYEKLRGFKSGRDAESMKKLKENVEFKSNRTAFNRELKKAKTEFKDNTKEMTIWMKIFCEVDEDSEPIRTKKNRLIPNRSIYGYITSKEVEDMMGIKVRKYVDTKKTVAKNIIEDAVEFVKTEYYYIEQEKALKEDETREGAYDEWFYANHTFNKFTKKWEPLRIWTTIKAKPNKHFNVEYEYLPNDENVIRLINDKYKNKKYSKYSRNYNTTTGVYNNHSKLTNKEKAMAKFIQEDVLNKYAKNKNVRYFVDQGYLPRRAKHIIDSKYVLKNAFGALGVEMSNSGEKPFSDTIGYEKDFDADMPMMQLLRGKGSKQLIPIPTKKPYMSQEDYDKEVEKIKKANDEIIKDNLEIDNALLDRDWENVFKDFINNAVVYNAKEEVKDTIYLLLDSLKDNQAFKVSKLSGKLVVDNQNSTDTNTNYRMIDQRNTVDLVENWARRLLFNQYKENSKLAKYADLVQNITSSKYMILNVVGGVSNVAIGDVNIMNERIAARFFDNKTFLEAKKMYGANSLAFISNDEGNFANALINFFNVVNYDDMLQRRPNETVHNYTKRVRSSLYAFQSGGEHFMQNTVLFAMLKSHRVFKDGDKMKIGSVKDYTWKVEQETLTSLIENDANLLKYYKTFVSHINSDVSRQKEYIEFRRDYIKEFLDEIGDRQLAKEYFKLRDENLAKAEKEFKENYKTVEEWLTLNKTTKQIEIKPEFGLTAEDKKQLERELARLSEKTKSVNNKIHGVYNKLGAARIEKEWWGSLVMQYHKHIYPGIMKRWRRKAYYNEVRGVIEKGSYISFIDLLSIEYKKAIAANRDSEGKINALNSLKAVYQGSLETAFNIGYNWTGLAPWERENIRSILGDLIGVASAFVMALLLHLATDDDEIKDSDMLATLVYFADRLHSESIMYTPWGLYTEASTLWSSPIASMSGASDLLKGLSIGTKMLFDKDFDPYYTTGLYRGQHKAAVMLYRNIPIYRIYNRLTNMSKNNNYYRINDTSNIIGTSKNVADFINPD